MFRFVSIVVVLAAAGCTGVAQTGLPEDHPANEAAPVAALPMMSDTLALPAGGASEQSPARGDRSRVPDAHAGHGEGHAAPSGLPGHQGHAMPTTTTKPSPGRPLYFCPMHVEVVSAKPDDRCPRCKMKINKPVRATTSAPTRPAGAPDHSHHGGH